MSNAILERIREYAVSNGEHIALKNPLCKTQEMSYRELWCKADCLAAYLKRTLNDENPIIVYGHKNPYMIVAFLGCLLSGHAYCPVDITMPADRVEMILEQTNSGVILAIEEYKTEKTAVLTLDEIEDICNCGISIVPELTDECISGKQTNYIIFTSGSTGTPKGVEISAECLENFLVWSSTLGEENAYGEESIFLNQAPFSFDLSVMDLYTSLYCGATLCMMEKSIQKDLSAITPFIKENNITALVMTPSFGNICLADKNFNGENITSLNSFFFCGETLTNKTAQKILKRFPNAVIQNTYGPTESTVAVSSVRITDNIIRSYEPLPVGRAKNNTEFIIDANGYDKDSDGNVVGEILITGNTLAKGYYKRRDLTDKAFVRYEKDGQVLRAYRTGDMGYLIGEQLFYIGRIDLQIKLNGYRIELGDIENSVMKNDIVSQCVICTRVSGGQVKSLVGVVVLNDKTKNGTEAESCIKNELSKSVPSYMVPQSFYFIDSMPMTTNGKIDRKKLNAIIEEI